MTLKPITIVGGGLAGLTLGIALRRRGIPVTLWEAGTYPRHRVCGEFISGRGQTFLEQLGLGNKLIEAGACLARTVALFSGTAASRSIRLPEPALCLSRFRLDALLADKFRIMGGDLRLKTRWRESLSHEGVVRATGRKVAPCGEDWRWIGLKVHARAVSLATDLELHFSSNAYVGLCRLADGEVNICGLFRTRTPLPDLMRRWPQLLRGPTDSQLAERLAGAVYDSDSFCSVAGLSFEISPAKPSGECAIGDALVLIPPVTGNGMSLALESAELATKPIYEFSRGELSWTQTQREIERECNQRFSTRLKWAARLHRLLFLPPLRTLAGLVLIQSPRYFQKIFALTR
jgi:menaquinone-9 beta-reductase